MNQPKEEKNKCCESCRETTHCTLPIPENVKDWVKGVAYCDCHQPKEVSEQEKICEVCGFSGEIADGICWSSKCLGKTKNGKPFIPSVEKEEKKCKHNPNFPCPICINEWIKTSHIPSVESNFMQVGRTTACGHCDKRFIEGLKLCEKTIPNYKCGCKCHDTPKDLTVNWEVDYCKKFGLCESKGKCHCREELRFIRKVVSQAQSEHNQDCTREEWARASERQLVVKELWAIRQEILGNDPYLANRLENIIIKLNK